MVINTLQCYGIIKNVLYGWSQILNENLMKMQVAEKYGYCHPIFVEKKKPNICKHIRSRIHVKLEMGLKGMSFSLYHWMVQYF